PNCGTLSTSNKHGGTDMSTVSFTADPTVPAGMSILQDAEGHAFTPLVGNSTVPLTLDYGDNPHMDDRVRDTVVTVTDLITGSQHRIRRSDCGDGCFCAAEI